MKKSLDVHQIGAVISNGTFIVRFKWKNVTHMASVAVRGDMRGAKTSCGMLCLNGFDIDEGLQNAESVVTCMGCIAEES